MQKLEIRQETGLQQLQCY